MDIRDQRERNWFWINNCLIDTYGKTLGPYGITLYLALARYSDNAAQTCFPSIKTLAEKTAMSPRKVSATLRDLESLGLIRKLKRMTAEGDETSSEYTLLDILGGGAPHAPPSEPSAPRVVHHMHHGGAPHAPLYKDSVEQNLIEKDLDIINIAQNQNFRSSQPNYSPGFLRFLSIHPWAKQDKKEAYKVWQQRKLESLADEICNGTLQQKQWSRWKGNDGFQYFKRMPSFLRQGSWEDEDSGHHIGNNAGASAIDSLMRRLTNGSNGDSESAETLDCEFSRMDEGTQPGTSRRITHGLHTDTLGSGDMGTETDSDDPYQDEQIFPENIRIEGGRTGTYTKTSVSDHTKKGSAYSGTTQSLPRAERLSQTALFPDSYSKVDGDTERTLRTRIS